MQSRRSLMQKVVLFVIALIVLGCTDSNTPSLPPKVWEDVTVRVESRPPVVQQGMNEFLIIATYKGVGPAADLVVSLRMDDEDRWHQAIQDGHMGVYRRAIIVPDPNSSVLSVRVRYKKTDQQGVLKFPLALQTEGSRDK